MDDKPYDLMEGVGVGKEMVQMMKKYIEDKRLPVPLVIELVLASVYSLHRNTFMDQDSMKSTFYSITRKVVENFEHFPIKKDIDG